MKTQHLLLGETAKLLGIKPYRLAYALSTGLVEEPKLRISNKRIFQQEDIQRLKTYLSTKEITMRKGMIGDCEVNDSGMGEFLSLTAIAKLYHHDSPHSIGKWLAACGLREKQVAPSGKSSWVPTQKATSGGYVREDMLPHGHPMYLWHKERTLFALKKAGHILPEEGS
jgi:hypothetical protein